MRASALFLSREAPVAGRGGGGLRSASLLEYLRARYQVDVAGFSLRPHSKAMAARVWRNSLRLLRRRPPLLDRYSGYENQLAEAVGGRQYDVGLVEHFSAAPYADFPQPHSRRL